MADWLSQFIKIFRPRWKASLWLRLGLLLHRQAHLSLSHRCSVSIILNFNSLGSLNTSMDEILSVKPWLMPRDGMVWFCHRELISLGIGSISFSFALYG